MKNLFTLALIAAGTFSASQPEIPAGQLLADVPDEIADALIADGRARLATDDDKAPHTEPKASKGSAKTVQARVLVDCAAGRVDTVATLPADQAKAMERAGQVDTDKAAVAYALSLRKAD